MDKDSPNDHPSIPNLQSSIPNLASRISNHCIYTGAFAALEARWMETILELQQEDSLGEVNVLVGSNILASYLKRRFAEQGRTAANIRFHTFLDLVSRLTGNNSTAASAPQLPPLGPAIILETMLAEQVPPVYVPLSGYKGFRDALLETFRDLRDAGISPDELGRTMQSGRDSHLHAFLSLYRRYRAIASRFRAVDDDFREAIDRVARSNTVLSSPRLLIYGIYDATGQQRQLLAALQQSFSMIYFIPYADKKTAAFADSFLQSCIKELGVSPQHLFTQCKDNSLTRLAEKSFGFSPEAELGPALSPDGSFSLVSAPGETRAAVETIREILRALRDGTIAGFHEAAIVMRQSETDLPILAEMLRLRGIPYFIHGGARFSERPISKAVLAISRLEAANFSRDAILVAMELIAAALPEKTAAGWDVESWRLLTNNPRFLAGLRSWDAGMQAMVEQTGRAVKRWESPPASDEDPDEAALSSIDAAQERLKSVQRLQEAWLLVRHAAADWPDSLSWADWAHHLEERLGRILEPCADWPHFLTVLDQIANLQTLEQFEIRDLRFAWGCSSKRVRMALEDSIASLSYPVGRFQRNGVNLLSTSAARGLRFPLVIIPGVDEGRFPAKLRQDPLLPDSERKRMKDLPLKSKRGEEEKFLFDMAARSAEKRLILMTSRLDESSDRERIPSQFFLRAAAAVCGCPVSLRDLNAETIPGFRSVSLDAPAPALHMIPVDEGEIRLRLIASEKDLSHRVVEALAEREPLLLKRPLSYDTARWKKSLTEFDGRIFHPLRIQWTVEKIAAVAGQVSASRFEEYAKCPYAFYMKRVQGLEAWEDQGKVEGMDPLERGTAIHAILETFLKDFVGTSFLSVAEAKLQQSLEQLAYTELEKARPAGMPNLLWEIERDALMQVLRNWLAFERERADDGMRIARLEQPFGTFSGVEPFPSFKLSAGKYLFDFRGRIDRVDISLDGKQARVIDYKTGKMPDSMSRKTRPILMGGERIQLAVYRGALADLLDFEKLASVDAEYLFLQPGDGKVRSCILSELELFNASKALPHILEILGEGMENGIFFAKTSGTVYPYGHCDYCDFLMVCGKDRMKREVWKAEDPAVIRFFKIMEPPQ
jgi:ATP-dependent helicase/nuclease subunit B